MIDGAIATFSSALATCCGRPEDNTSYYGKPSAPVPIEPDRRPFPDLSSSHTVPEKSFVPVYQQPSFTPPPWNEPMRHRRGPSPSWEQAPGKRHDHDQAGLSLRERFFPSKSKPRRPQISAPTDFVHLTSGAPGPSEYQVPEIIVETAQPRSRQRSFRPLELNIHNSNGRLSSMLPYFGCPNPPVTPPGRIMDPSSSSEDSIVLKHQQSSSTMSFRIPRKPTPLGSVFDSSPDSDIIHRPSPARLRAQASSESTTATMDELIERVATAMKERDNLQDQIDDAIERQSIYVSSRPGTAHSMANANMEPMPQVPALPPNAPSFSERISLDHPRHTPMRKPVAALAPPPRSLSRDQTVHGLSLSRGVMPPPKSLARGRAGLAPSSLSRRAGDPPPPLRKKKSFSRVSTWLGFPAEISDNAVFGSVRARSPPALREAGLYEVRPAHRKASFRSDDTVSDWTSDDTELDVQTLPTTNWSPSSSGAETIRASDHAAVLGPAPWRQSVVGVAF